MGNDGPLLIDSLDRPNAPVSKPTTQKPIDPTALVLGIITLLLIVMSLLFVFVVIQLRYKAEYQFSTAATVTLWIIYAAPVIFLVASIIAGIYAGMRWLHIWVKRSNLISLQTGPHYKATKVETNDYDKMFMILANRMFDIAEERARQSTYQGVQTLTNPSKSQDIPAPAIPLAIIGDDSIGDMTKEE